MTGWLPVVQLGDLALTLPTAAAIGAWLVVCGARPIALRWCGLFGLAIALVGASKIAFMAWGAGFEQIGFKALSGHAAGTAALYPVLFYLLVHRAGIQLRALGVAAGLGLGLLVARLLVLLQEHSAAEAIAGWCLGALVSLATVHRARIAPVPRPLAGLAGFALVFAAAAWLMQSAPVGYWMIRTARILSGNEKLYPLSME